METKEYDLIVIGTGSAGSVAAVKCNEAGWKVAMIDEKPYGGTCALRGCDPKKVLVGAAELVDWNKRMDGHGIDEDTAINWQDLMKFKRTFTSSVPEKKEAGLNKRGIDTYHGKASFHSETVIKVDEEVLKGKHILLATGSQPATLGIDGEEYFTHSDEFLEMDQLPERILFVGGGYISFEFAHVAARAGAEVHILHRGSRPLENFDADLVDLLMQKSKEVGIHVHLNTSVTSIEKQDQSFTVKADQKGTEKAWSADLVVHGAGRVPALDMNLEQGNVEREKQGVIVNEYLQSVSNPHVYAAGDVAATAGPPLTPMASTESHVVASNLLNGNHKNVDYPVVPSVVFTIPKMASAGMSEQEAKDSGINVEVNHQEMAGWYTYKRTNESYAAFKIITNKDNGLILGAHLISGEADELINHFAMAIQFKIPINELKQMIFAYPTSASDIAHML
ncbi:dihydrolipoyl dehydrogenase family protein [Pseudalkalibacillus sp. JSM 102089]|uniref:dihydrolipoyl dehydrogenase family protein n=1 Tax=Pseudalkalibacillus sp. JSM 102089 TaxID=3229856 RepID=UPI003523C962